MDLPHPSDPTCLHVVIPPWISIHRREYSGNLRGITTLLIPTRSHVVIPPWIDTRIREKE